MYDEWMEKLDTYFATLRDKPWWCGTIDYDKEETTVWVEAATYDGSLPKKIGDTVLDVRVGWWNKPLVTPGCCQEVIESEAIILRWALFYLADEEAFLRLYKEVPPRWYVRCIRTEASRLRDALAAPVEASFCPFCGTPVPPVVRREELLPMTWTPDTNGGYHCGTCGERDMGCGCLGASWYWAPGDPDVK